MWERHVRRFEADLLNLQYTPALARVVVRGVALLAEMGDRLLEGGRAYAKDAGVGKSEFEDKKKGESNAGRPGRHRGHDERIRFRKDSESEKQRDRPKDQNDDQALTDRPARDLKGHQEPRSCDLIGEGAHGRESMLLIFGRRREGAEKSLDRLSRRERNRYGQALRID